MAQLDEEIEDDTDIVWDSSDDDSTTSNDEDSTIPIYSKFNGILLYCWNIVVYYTPTLLYARITHFQPCTITQSSERISGQIRVFARILRFCPHTPFRPSPGFASDYCIVTSYLNAFILLNYNDICLYKQYTILRQQNVSALRWSYSLARTTHLP